MQRLKNSQANYAYMERKCHIILKVIKSINQLFHLRPLRQEPQPSPPGHALANHGGGGPKETYHSTPSIQPFLPKKQRRYTRKQVLLISLRLAQHAHHEVEMIPGL